MVVVKEVIGVRLVWSMSQYASHESTDIQRLHS